MDFEVVNQDEELAKSRIGDVVNGKWKLVQLLGCGGMAAVFGAEGTDGRRVALKMLHPQMSRIRDIRDRFLREGTVANHVGHPGVVQVLEQTSKDDATAVLVMELLEGESLSDVLRRSGHTLPVPKLLEYLDQLLDVLVAAHARGIVHRDLKPDNLFVTRAGTLKVLDFGIARVRDGLSEDQRTRTGVLLGTLPFMSPEQALGKRNEVDGRTDLFAAGAIAFYATSGRCIHACESEGELIVAMATRSAPPLASIVPGAPADLCAIVDQALAFSKDARYPDARTMQADVKALRDGHTPPYAGQQARQRSQSTQAMIAPVVAPAKVAVPAALTGAATSAGAAKAVTSARPPESPTRAGPPMPATSARTVASKPPVPSPPTVVGPTPDSATRVSAPPAVTVVGPTPDSVTRVSDPLPRPAAGVSAPLPATVVGPTPDSVTRVSDPHPPVGETGSAPARAAALPFAVAASAAPSGGAPLSTATPGVAPVVAASTTTGRDAGLQKRNAAIVAAVVLVVAGVAYLLGTRAPGDSASSAEVTASKADPSPASQAQGSQSDDKAAERTSKAREEALKRAEEARKPARGKKKRE